MSTIPYSFRIDEDVKIDFEAVLDALGMNAATAFNIFARRVIAERGIPFDVRVPDVAINIEPNLAERMNSASEFARRVERERFVSAVRTAAAQLEGAAERAGFATEGEMQEYMRQLRREMMAHQ